jgi:hypothetical protein
LNSIDKLDELEIYKQKKHKEKTKQETQLLVPTNKALVPANGPSVYFIINFSNFFDNLDFVILLANYNLLDLF